MPLNVLKKLKPLAQMRKEEAQQNTVIPGTAAMIMPLKAHAVDIYGKGAGIGR